jgi:tetratricopeptide (TPR) repeat protein
MTKRTYIQTLFAVLVTCLPFIASSCVSLEMLISESKLAEAEQFCSKTKGDEQKACYFSVAEAYVNEIKFNDNTLAPYYYKINYEKALDAYQKAGKEKEGSKKMAEYLFKSGYYEASYTYYNIAGEGKTAALRIADTLLKGNDLENAFAFYKKANEAERGARRIGSLLIASADYVQALKYFGMADLESEGYKAVGRQFYANGWYGWAMDCYRKAGNLDSTGICTKKIAELLRGIPDGKIFDKNLPENEAVLLTDYAVISNSENYELKLTSLFSEGQIKQPVQPAVYRGFIAGNVEWNVLGVTDSLVISHPLFSDKKPQSVAGQSSMISDMLLLSNGVLFTSSWDGSVVGWNISTGARINIVSGSGKPITSIAASEKAGKIVSGGWDETIRIWDLKTGNLLRTIRNNSPVMDLDITPNGRYIAACSKNNVIRIYDTETGTLSKTFEGHKSYVRDLEISRDGNYLISGDLDGVVKIWDLGSGKLLRSFQAHQTSVTSISIAPNSFYFITCGLDHLIRFWWLADKNNVLMKIENSGL